jgi:glycosyltransferase involved in cell wall biosynthesis
MLIAVNTRMLLPGKLEGIGYFSKEAFSRITKNHPEHEFLFLFDRPFSQEFIFNQNVHGMAIGLPARHPVLWYLWYEQSLPRIFKKIKPDLFVSPDGYLSLGSNVKSLAVIHDINFEHYPADLPFLKRRYYRHYFPLFAERATRIATVSEFSRKDIAQHYHVPESKIDIAYNGANEGFTPAAADLIKRIRKRWTQGQPYFIFIGSIHSRKNIVRLLLAFDAFRHTTASTVKLVFAGAKRWWSDEMQQTLDTLSHKEDVLFTGRLEDNDLHDLTAAALAVTYVSNFEGFGIPIVEGMRAGVPVITSNVTSMPEVAGGAAHLVDPFSIESITNGLLVIYRDEALRKKLIAQGLQRSREFSWDNTATALWESMMKTLA